jgi:3-hydroxyacyl-[acyl-carrier-protein] dehydratase
MRFQLVDRINAFTPGVKLSAIKRLTLGEEYLADHFPSFPVMPGVLMLETLVQAAAWLVRLTEEFAPTIVTLREVKGVKYGTFMPPGQTMHLSVEVQGPYNKELNTVSFKGTGDQGSQSVVNARFVLAKYRLSEARPELATVDDQLTRQYRQEAALLLAA